MIVSNRPQSSNKNGEKKGEPLEPHSTPDDSDTTGDHPPRVESKEQPADAAKEPHRTMHEQATKYIEQARQQLRERAEATWQRLAPVEKWVHANTRAHPYEAIAAAGGAAFLAGALLRRAAVFGLGVAFVLFTAYSLLSKPASSKQTDLPTK